MHAVAAAGVDVPCGVELDAVGDTGVGVGEDASVGERLRGGVDVEFVAVWIIERWDEIALG